MSKSKYEFQRNLAIIIGINDYSNGVPRLETAVPDAEEFARIIKDQYQYEVHLLLNQDATLDRLKHLIECFNKKQIPFGKDPEINDTDRILLYFAGHGIAFDAKDNQEGPVGYLIPQDATENSNTYLPMQEFHDALLKLPCRHLLVILDCCFSGAFYWSSINRDVVPKVKVYKQVYDHYIKYKAWQVITSTSDKQTAVDSSPRGKVSVNSKVHSPFAKHLFDALNKGADLDNDGIITANDLFNFLRKAVAVETEEYKAQTPGICPLKLHDNGEYLFLLQSDPNLENAPPLDLEKSPYRGLESYEEEHQDLYFGRKEQIEQLYKTVISSNNRSLTVVLGASGTGKSSLVKAGLIPLLRTQKLEANSSLQKWEILKPIRLGESPLTALKNSLSQELNFTSSNPNSDPSQTDEPKWFSKLFNWLGIGNQPNRAKQNQQLEQEVELLSKNLKNWFKNNPDRTLLMTIDQFEELITLQPRPNQKEEKKKQKENKRNEEENKQKTQQELVIKWLPEVMSKYGDRLRIILTLRSDFESQFQDGTLNKYWTEEARFHIKEMTTAELREAITEPASKKSIFFVPNTLVDKLVDEVAGMPGTLPLLSFTLNELYRIFVEDVNNGDKDDRAITEEYYKKLGGVARSLTQKAEQEYESLVNQDKAYEQTIRRVMLRMVAIGGGELARRRVLKSELKYPEPENTRVLEVVKTFVKARLLVEGKNTENQPYVEPAHDALVRGWERLLKWKQEEEENLILQRQLTPAAVEWKIERAELKNYLWHNNPRLDLLKKELKSEENWFNELEAEFVQISIGHKNFNTRLAWIVAISVILGLSAGLIASLIGQRNALIGQIRSSQQASEASWQSKQQLDALLNSLKAAKILQDWPWYLSWFRPDADLQSEVLGTLRTVVYGGRQINEWDEEQINDISFNSQDNLLLAKREKDGTVNLKNLSKNLEIKLPVSSNFTWFNKGIRFSRNGELIAVADEKGNIYLWQTEELWQTKENPTQPFKSFSVGYQLNEPHLVFSSDNKKIAIVNSETSGTQRNNSFINVSLWDVSDERPKEIKPQREYDTYRGIGFDSQNRFIVAYTGENNDILYLSDFSSGTNLENFKVNPEELEVEDSILVFNPDENCYQFIGYNKFFQIERPSCLSQNYQNISNSLRDFKPNSKEIITIDHNGNISFTPGDKFLYSPLNGHLGRVAEIAFSANGDQLASVGFLDSTIRLWNLQEKQIVKKLIEVPVLAKNISLSPNGSLLAMVSQEGTLQLFNRNGIEEKIAMPDNNKLCQVAFSPTGQKIAVVTEQRKAYLLDLNGNILEKFDLLHDSPQKECAEVIFTPHGSLGANINDKFFEFTNSKTIREIPLNGETIIGFDKHNNPLLGIRQKISQEETAIFVKNTLGKLMFRFDMNNEKSEKKSIAFPDLFSLSLDHSLFATVDSKGISLWNFSGEHLFKISEDVDVNKNISFSADGSLLALLNKSGQVEMWKLGGFNDLLSKSCEYLSDYLQTNPNVSENDRKLCDGVPLDPSINATVTQTSLDTNQQSEIEGSITDQISMGDKILVPVQTPTHPDKQAGIDAIAVGNFQQAVTSLTSYLNPKKNPNDPEARIYLNNAQIEAQQSESYTIAVSVPISSNINGSLEILRGVAQAQDDFNNWAKTQQGIVPIRILIADDHNDPKVAQEIAKELANNPDVLGVVGHYASDVTLATGEIYQSQKLVAISPISTSVNLSKVLGEYVFRTVPSDKIAAIELANYMDKQLQKKKAVVFYNNENDYSRSMKSEFESAITSQGGQVLKAIDLSDPNFNADQVVEDYIQQGAEVLVLMPNTEELNDAIKVIEANNQRLPLLAGDGMYNPTILEKVGLQAVNMVVAIPWHIKAHPESNFSKKSKVLWGERDVNWRTAMSYDAAKALMAAIKEKNTRQEIAQLIRSEQFQAQGAIEPVQFSSGDRKENIIQLVKIVKPEQKSSSGYDHEFKPVENNSKSKLETPAKSSK